MPHTYATLTLRSYGDVMVVHRYVAASLVAMVGISAGCSSAARRSQSSGSPLALAHGVPAKPKNARLLITPRGISVAVVSHSSTGYRVVTPCGKTALVKQGSAIGRVDVMIDPGHGGSESGASANGIRESILNLHVARELQLALSKLGIRSALTRTGDYRVTIATRAKIVNVMRPKLFVSVHHNSGVAAAHDGPGTEVYYQHASAESKRLAGLLWNHLVPTLAQFHAHWVGASDAGAIQRLGNGGDDFFGVLRQTHGIPAALIEPSYISEASQAALLKTDAFRQAEARAIAAGIDRYLHSSDAGSGYKTPLNRGASDPGGGGTNEDCHDPKL